MGNSTSCKIITPKNFILKLCTQDYVREITRHANFSFNRYSGGFSPNMENITTLWLFWLSCSYLFSRSYAQVDIHALWLKRRVSAQGWSFWGLEQWVTIFGENMPQNSPNMGVNRKFPAKTAKYKNCNTSKTINRIKTKFEDQAETGNCTSLVV